jgi:hypothetical protein
MKKSHVLSITSIVLLIVAGLLTFMPPKRYGTHTDARPCNENAAQQSFYTATGYYIFTQSLDKSSVSIGTCPYQNFNASTYALELWLPGIALGYLGYRKRKLSEHASKSNLD